jgi:hypothetical protein
MKKSRPAVATTVDEYLADVSEPARGTLKKVRAPIRSTAPSETAEGISWGMPMFKYKGMLLGIAAFSSGWRGQPALPQGREGEELTVLAAGAIAGMPLRNLPGDVVVEYTVALSDGDVMLVTCPRDDWSYKDFRLFLGSMGAVAERRVSNVIRLWMAGRPPRHPDRGWNHRASHPPRLSACWCVLSVFAVAGVRP